MSHSDTEIRVVDAFDTQDCRLPLTRFIEEFGDGLLDAVQSQNPAVINAEMGTGKTMMAIAAAAVMNVGAMGTAPIFIWLYPRYVDARGEIESVVPPFPKGGVGGIFRRSNLCRRFSPGRPQAGCPSPGGAATACRAPGTGPARYRSPSEKCHNDFIRLHSACIAGIHNCPV